MSSDRKLAANSIFVQGSAIDRVGGVLSEPLDSPPLTTSIDRPRILLADDDAVMRDYLRRLLSHAYRVETAADGMEAMAAIDRQPPDLVLTDVMMPNLNGLELLRSIRANLATQDIPVILLSAKASEDYRIAGLEAGADDYLVKPFPPRELVARVDATLKLARLRLNARDRERALQQQTDLARANLDRIVANINNGFATFDRQWRYTYVNNRLLEIFDLPCEAVLGKQAWEVFPNRVGVEFFDLLNRAMTDRVEEQFEYYYPQIECWVEHRVYPTAEGLAILMADVTERKRRESNAAFLDEIAQELSRLSTPDEMMQSVGVRLGEFLNLSGCIFGDVDDAHNEVTIHHGWTTAEVPSLKQTFRLEEYLTAEFSRASRAGETVIICDTANDERADGESYARLQIGSLVTVPFCQRGRWMGYIAVTKVAPYAWRADETALIQEISSRIFPRIERARAEAALRESEAKYRTLFDSIDEGFCIIEMLFDDREQPVDYRFLQVNLAFFRLTGLPADAVGKTMRELVPDIEDFWMGIYGNVVLTGAAMRFENYSAEMNRWFDVYATRVGDAANRHVAIVFTNITERKQAENISQRAAKLDAFRIALADALRPLANPVEIQATASRVLGEYLGANRVLYFEIRGTNYFVDRDYVNGAIPLSGSYPIDSFSPKVLASHRAGRTASVSDVAAAPDLSPAQKAAYAAIGIAALLDIPLVKNGEFVAGLAIHASQPREWTPDEITLAEEVAERTWAAIERARAEAAIADNLRDTQLLRELSARLVSEDNIDTLYREILAAAIAITGADAGTLQLLDDRTQDLCIIAAQGIEPALAAHFQRVNASSNTSCGRALHQGTRMFMDFDAPDSPDPDGSLRLHLEAGLLSAQSTPLISRTGKTIGMVSTHWRTRHQPNDSPKERLRQREIQFLDLLARQAADTLEQRQTATALHEREEQLRLATEASKLGMWFWNLETDTLTWTERCKAIFGLPADTQMSYEVFLAALHPDDRQYTHEAVTRSQAERTDYDIEYRSCWPDGTVHWVAAKGSCTYNSTGTPTQMLGVAIDITDRKQVEDALRASEAQLAVELADMQQLQQISSQLIWEDNIDELYQQILDAAISLMCSDLGIVYMFDPDSNELRLLASRGLPPAAAEFWQCVNIDTTNTASGRAATSCEPIFISDIETCDALVGTPDLDFARLSGIRSVQSVPLISRNGRIVGTICTQWRTPHQPSDRRLRLLDVLARQVADLLDRKQAEAALAQSEEKSRTILESITDAFIALDENWQYTYVNSTAEEMLFRPPGYLIGKNIWAEYPGLLGTEFEELYRRVAANGVADSATLFFPDHARWYEVRVYPVAAGLTIYCSNVTDRKLAEATLAERARQLADLNTRLAQSEIQLQERNQELDSFVHIVSHDLKAPLRAVSNLSVWIEEDLEGTVSENTTEQMNLLRGRIGRMEGMIDGLLQYARVGRQDNQVELVSVADLVTEAIESIAPPATFSIEIATPMPTLETKRLLLSQVFANLISNACKHHDRSDGSIRISSRDLGDSYELAVADDGPGIAPEYRDRVFIIFQSANAQKHPDSTGVGLSIVKKIVETAGGRIWLESELGRGTTFYFTWPHRSIDTD